MLNVSRTVNLLEVLIVLLAIVGIPMHVWGWHDAVLDEGAILAGARNTSAGAMLWRLARGHARSEALRLGIKVIILVYGVAAMGYPSGPFGPWAQATIFSILGLLTLETWLQRWDRHQMMRSNARMGVVMDIHVQSGIEVQAEPAADNA